MSSWQQIAQTTREMVDLIIRFVKARRREEAALGLGGLLLWFGHSFSQWLPADLTEFLKPLRVVLIVQIALYLIAVSLLAYGVFRIWRLVRVPVLPPERNRPSAIKGPMAFTEEDGELFRKLGRESDLQKLLGLILDNQVLMVVVRGESGAGKTSLLRAGLKHILGDRALVHYWEAMPTESEDRLLHAVQEKWPGGAAKLASLDELVNLSDNLNQQAHVIVLDQFEQLRGSKSIFRLLRKIAREAKPPHRITWVIAFRREFSADWLDFVSPEQERGFRSLRDLSLRLFAGEQACDVVGQLAHESDLAIDQAVVDDLVKAATVEGEVSPVDIGIGLLVLTELHERQGERTVTIHDYRFAGGAEGLLTQYITRCLEMFPKEDQETLLKALLELRDPVTDQRIAEGLTVETIAGAVGAEGHMLKRQLDVLVQRDVRLLEIVRTPGDSTARYRLPHERLIPALYRVTGRLLAEADQAKLKFEDAFLAWKKNDRQSRYLLGPKELRFVERFVTQIPWGKEEHEKKDYLRLSQRRRRLFRTIWVTAGLVVMALLLLAGFQYERFEQKRFLRESGYPPDLYEAQRQLKKMELNEPLDLDRFTWLSSDVLEELSLHAATSSNSIAGIASLSRCRSLKRLTLDLHDSQVTNLEPLSKLSNLTQLTLDLRFSQVSKLEPLSTLSNLTQLKLDLQNNQVTDLVPLLSLGKLTQLTLDLGYGSKVTNLEPLSRLSKRTQLTLNLGYVSSLSELEPLSKLSNPTQLTLDLSIRAMNDLEPLSKLSHLTQLMLKLGNYDTDVNNLEPFSKLSNLAHLTLNRYYGTKVTNLEPLSKLNNLAQLTLDLSGSEVTDLEPLSKLSNLTQLTLDLGYGNGAKVTSLEPLSKLSNLTQLTLDLRGGEVTDLEPLSKLSNLTQLTLDLGYGNGAKVTSLEPLSKLSNLTQLTLHLRVVEVTDLEPLSKLNNLRQMKLDLRGGEVTSLEPLLKLSNLTQLTLNTSDLSNWDLLAKLSNSLQLTLHLWGKLQPNLELLSGLSNKTQLTLDLHHSDVGDLSPLSKVNNLTQLTLDLPPRVVSESERAPPPPPGEIPRNEVSDLKPLSRLPSLRVLSIGNANRAQRMSLRTFPPQLLELSF